MYQTLWNSINKQVKNSHAYAAFLAVSLMGWTTIGLLAGFLICMIGGMSFVTKVTVVLCSGGYTGLIFGFFGGILYLYRSEPRHLAAATPSQVFPQQLAVNDYFIQDPRYLQTYANYFCKFIDAYKEQGIPISMIMFQNESWSYTNYPGCAWTAEGIIRFNTEYLAPTLKKQHPEVKLYLGTINTNRYEVIDQVLSDPRMPETIEGVGLQWEGGQILSKLRAKYPQYKYVQTESECGWGSFDWKAAEHTFGLMNHYLGNGCEEYTFWNAILYDGGFSGWGWKQNALIHVDSKTGSATYTPEYYAVKHYSHYVTPGSKVLAYKDRGDRMPVMIVMTPQKKQVVIAGNFDEEAKELTVKLGTRYLNVTLQPHSLNTFIEK